ncbi:hypothetical protein LFL97_31045 [Burkholderia sp. JSH-S8]|nr:hypothetical protein LFL97_31045 [Burkholderia sp. JSH-S8]
MNGNSRRRRAIKFVFHTLSGIRGQCNFINVHVLRAAGLAIFGMFLLSLGSLGALARTTSDTRHMSTHEQHVVSADMRGASQVGTEADPLIVKVEPTVKSPAEVAQDAKDRADKLASDQQSVDINRQLVWVGILQVVVFVLQLGVFGFQAYKLQQTVKASAEQSSDMKASIRESARAADAMEQVAMNSMRAAQHASESVTMLKERTAQQMRAYLSIDIGSALYQERGKNLRFEGKALLRNAGHTPAYRVSHTCRAGILPMPLPDNFDLPQPTQPARGGGVIGPGQSRILSAMIEEFVPDDEVDAIKIGMGRALYIWGRVTYEDAFGAQRHTNFCQALTWQPNNSVLGYFIDRHDEAN